MQLAPPWPVPGYQPLRRLREALALDQGRPRPAVADDDRAWLRDRADELVDTFTTTQFPLGVGLIHADARHGNLVFDHEQGH